jgi:hypothetical protein
MTTRRKKTPDPAPAAEPPAITAANLAEFIGIEGDPIRLERAIRLSTAAAAAELGIPALPADLPHPLAQAVKLLATKLLIVDQLEQQPSGDDIPLVVRYYLKVHAGAQG